MEKNNQRLQRLRDWLRDPRGRLQTAWRFLRLVSNRFVEDQGLPNAASLTYTTLLSLVPLMTVSLAVFAAFPISDRVAVEVQNFLFENFVPTSGAVLQGYFQEFSDKASHLTGPGFASLVVVALLLMENIDRAFNHIWRSSHKRRPLAKFLEYWAVLTLGPILMGLSMVATSYLVSIPVLSDAAAKLDDVNRLLKLAPLLASIVAFTLLYTIVPNRRVPIRHALAGALLAALLFEAAKRALAYYVTNFPSYEAIYGALAMVPIFLVWVYLSWAVTLLGAEFACCLGLYRDLSYAHPGEARNELLLSYQILRQLREGQRDGRTRSIRRIAHALDRYSEEQIEQTLATLIKARMVLRTEGGRWALARDLSDVRLLDLYRIRPLPIPSPELLELLPREDRLREVLQRIDDNLERDMEISVEELIQQQGAAVSNTPKTQDAVDEAGENEAPVTPGP